MKSYTENTRRLALSWLIFLKELNVTGSCRLTRENLLNTLTHETYTSKEVSKYFINSDSSQPLPIKETDPSQITALKQMYNAILSLESVMHSIESISVTNDRYTVGICMDLIENSFSNLDKLYEAVDLINHCTPEIQAIISPNIQSLFPKIMQLIAKSESFSPANTGETAKKFLTKTINELPTQVGTKQNGIANLCHIMFNLPSHFETLTSIIEANISALPSASSSSTHKILAKNNQQVLLLKKIKEAEKQFQKLSEANYTLIPHWLSTLKLLLNQTSSLLNSAAPLTKQAYIAATEQLNAIRHEHIPNMLIELESFEESLGLNPGTLTDPVLKKMDEYYTQLATSVSQIAMAAEVIDNHAEQVDSELIKWVRSEILGDKTPINVGKKLEPVPDLERMQDYDFLQVMRDAEVRRLRKHQNKEISINESEVNAANRFFIKLSEYNSWWYVGNMARLPSSDRDALLNDYQIFRSHFSSIYPQIDRLIMEALTSKLADSQWHLSASRELVDRVPELYELWYTNHFSTVLNYGPPYVEMLKTTLTQTSKAQNDADFKTRLINQTIAHRNNQTDLYTVYRDTADDPDNTKAILSPSEPQTLFGQVSSLKLSDAIDRFIKNDLETFISENVDPIIAQKLKNPPFPEEEFHKDSAETLIYKRAINALHSMKECLDKLERLHEISNPDYRHRRYIYLITINNALFMDLVNAKNNLSNIARAPQLNIILNKALDIISPLKAIPIVGDIIQTTSEQISLSPQENIIEAWRAQQAIVHKHTHKIDKTATHEPEPIISSSAIDQTAPKTTEEDESLLPRFANLLYQLPETIEQLSPKKIKKQHKVIDDETNERQIIEDEEAFARTELLKARANELVKIINEYSYWRPGFMQNILKAVEKINSQITKIGVSSRQVLEDAIHMLRSELSNEILELTDSSEFELGLMPGVLSTPIREKLDAFYLSIIEDLNIKNEQDRLKLLLTTQPIENRIKNEQNQLNRLMSNKPHEKLQSKIFSSDSEKLGKLQKRITFLTDDVYERESPEELDELFQKILMELIPLYQHHQPELFKINTKFTPNYLSTTTDPVEILSVIEAMQKVALSQEGYFNKLLRMKTKTLTDPNFFNHIENQTEFLQYYAELEPYFKKINKYHGRSYTLIELQTPDDFQQKLDVFISLQNPLEELIAGEREAYIQRIERKKNQITFLENELIHEKNAQGKKLSSFKDEVFSNYINNVIKKKFDKTMGEHYSAIFWQKMELNYKASKSIIPESIGLNVDIEKTVQIKLDQLDKTIRQSNKALIQGYEDLNRTKITLEHELKTELSNMPLPLRLQKMDAIRLMLTEFNQSPFELERINQQNTRIKKGLKSLQVFDHLLHIQIELETMRQYIINNPDTDQSINTSKITFINTVLQKIMDTSNPNMRALEVKKMISSPEFKKTMLNNSDNFIIKAIKNLLEFMNVWKNPLKQTLLNLKNQAHAHLNNFMFNRPNKNNEQGSEPISQPTPEENVHDDAPLDQRNHPSK